MTNKTYVASEEGEVIRWFNPDVDPPPLNAKIGLMTKGGVAAVGTWDNSHVAWHKLLGEPAWLKEKIHKAYLGTKK